MGIKEISMGRIASSANKSVRIGLSRNLDPCMVAHTQHSGESSRRDAEFEASLLHTVSYEDPVSKERTDGKPHRGDRKAVLS